MCVRKEWAHAKCSLGEKVELKKIASLLPSLPPSLPPSSPQVRRGLGIIVVEAFQQQLSPGGDENREGKVVEKGNHPHHHLT